MKKNRITIALVVTGGVFVLALGVYAFYELSRDRKQETIVIGTTIVSALESYRSTNGYYPQNINSLLPQYMSSIPQPTWGEGWDYRLLEDGHFELLVGCGENRYPAIYYNSRYNHWSYDH